MEISGVALQYAMQLAATCDASAEFASQGQRCIVYKYVYIVSMINNIVTIVTTFESVMNLYNLYYMKIIDLIIKMK